VSLTIKVCGVTTVADAEACVALGVDWIGLNFVPSSPRRIDVARAREIGDAIRGRAVIVGVVADLDEAAILDLLRDARLDRVQLHGAEPAELIAKLTPRAFKAVRVGATTDIAAADRYPGLLLVDAKVQGALGGTGKAVDPALVAPLARARAVMLAGGLAPDNVAAAVRAVAPWGIDTASGVERSPGVKDPARIEAFVANARGAA